jgi:transmembrane sensor
MSNEQENTRIDGLLGRYLSAETSAAENSEVLAWINASAENKNYFEGLKTIWENSSSENDLKVDTNAAWKKMQTRMNVNEPPARSFRPLYMRIAAGVAVFLLIGSLFYVTMKDGKQQPLKEFAATTISKSATLPDGSSITLNRNSSLTYPEHFEGKTREVNLKGEVFFDISHDVTHPFIIHTGSLDILVVGTSFDVNAFPERDTVRVSVQTGKVKCYTGKDTVTLVPGEIAVYTKSTGTLRKGIEGDPNTSSYRNRIFKFRQTPLNDVVRMLNNAYGSNIVITSDAIRNCGVDGDYKNEKLDIILLTIEDALKISMKKSEGKILLDGTSCPHP